MAKDFDNKKHFQTMLEKACKGTIVTPRELLRELVISGYKNLYSGDLSLEEVKMIVVDLVDSKEISGASSLKNEKKTAVTEIEEFETDEDDGDDGDDDGDDD